MRPTWMSLLLLGICFLSLAMSPFLMAFGVHPLTWFMASTINVLAARGILAVLGESK